MTGFELKRMLLLSAPMPVFVGIAGAFATRELWFPVAGTAIVAVAYFVWVWRWQRDREADEAIRRAAEEEPAGERGASRSG